MQALKEKAIVPALVAFTVLHLGTTLLRGVPDAARQPVWPLVAWYGDGLRMVNTWGMFSRRTEQPEVVVRVWPAEGEPWMLLHSSERASTLDRVRDVRLRKLLNNLNENGSLQRQGKELCRYACQAAADRSERVRRVEVLEAREGSAHQVAAHRCRACAEERAR